MCREQVGAFVSAAAMEVVGKKSAYKENFVQTTTTSLKAAGSNGGNGTDKHKAGLAATAATSDTSDWIAKRLLQRNSTSVANGSSLCRCRRRRNHIGHGNLDDLRCMLAWRVRAGSLCVFLLDSYSSKLERDRPETSRATKMNAATCCS